MEKGLTAAAAVEHTCTEVIDELVLMGHDTESLGLVTVLLAVHNFVLAKFEANSVGRQVACNLVVVSGVAAALLLV